MIKESIDLFKDDDPCIIHYTYSINSIAFKLLDELNNIEKSNNTNKDKKLILKRTDPLFTYLESKIVIDESVDKIIIH